MSPARAEPAVSPAAHAAPHEVLAPHPIVPRRVRFQFEDVPRHWLAGRPGVTHMMNALHVLFPPGERWFVRVAHRGLSQVTDPALRSAIRGFVGQEGLHARAHDEFVPVLREQGFPVDRMAQVVEREVRRRERLFSPALQMAVISGIEHYTSVLGQWAFEGGIFDEGCHPALQDLLLWHAAEEIEHQCVAFDLREALAPGYARRVLGLALATLGITLAWTILGFVFVRNDPTTTVRAALRDLRRLSRQGRTPFPAMRRAFLRYLRPGFHPSQERNLHLAEAYLARSPAVAATRR